MPLKTEKNKLATDGGKTTRTAVAENARLKSEVERLTTELAAAESKLEEAKSSAREWHLFFIATRQQVRDYSARLKIPSSAKYADCQRLIIQFGEEVRGLETTRLYQSAKAKFLRDGLPQLLEGLSLPDNHDGGPF